MGEKYLGQLTAKSAPATGDILVLEDSEDTKKIDYDALANAILNKLTTKTYTVAGGTNTLIAAIDALNSNTYMLEPSQSNMLANGTDILSLNNGVYFAGSNEVAVSLVNKPTGLDTNCKIIVEERIRGRKMVTVIAPYKVWVNQRVSGSEWGGWKLTPTRDEFDTLNSNMWKKASVTIPAGQTKSLVAGREELSCFVSITGPQTNIRAGLYYLSGYTTATRVTLVPLNASDNISFDMTNETTVTIPITNSSANQATLTVFVLRKTGSDITFQ